VPTREELMTISEANDLYGHSRQWWYTQAKEGRLTLYKIPGDRNSYVSKAEVLAMLEIRPKNKPADESDSKDAM
jgi:hypothetical protein